MINLEDNNKYTEMEVYLLRAFIPFAKVNRDIPLIYTKETLLSMKNRLVIGPFTDHHNPQYSVEHPCSVCEIADRKEMFVVSGQNYANLKLPENSDGNLRYKAAVCDITQFQATPFLPHTGGVSMILSWNNILVYVLESSKRVGLLIRPHGKEEYKGQTEIDGIIPMSGAEVVNHERVLIHKGHVVLLDGDGYLKSLKLSTITYDEANDKINHDGFKDLLPTDMLNKQVSLFCIWRYDLFVLCGDYLHTFKLDNYLKVFVTNTCKPKGFLVKEEEDEAFYEMRVGLKFIYLIGTKILVAYNPDNYKRAATVDWHTAISVHRNGFEHKAPNLVKTISTQRAEIVLLGFSSWWIIGFTVSKNGFVEMLCFHAMSECTKPEGRMFDMVYLAKKNTLVVTGEYSRLGIGKLQIKSR